MPHDPRVQKALSRVARATRHPANVDPAEIAEARAALAEAKIQAYIEKAVAEAPPLSAERRARIARLLTADGA
ncbi:hypothetical protein GCM10009798_23330 [Nocardioides panacihumi]|uniref:Uncharacterized protein n=1 Tax=Nocardioides panacihumi TaxID=400774 RepID=A0ABN2R3A5_9ACTN